MTEQINQDALALMMADAVQANARMRQGMRGNNTDPVDYEVKRQSEIIAYLQRNPNMPISTIAVSVTGDQEHIKKTVADLVDKGSLEMIIERRGKARVTVYAVKGAV